MAKEKDYTDSNGDFKAENEEGFDAHGLADVLDVVPLMDYGGGDASPQVWMCVNGEVLPVRMVLAIDDFEDARGGDVVLYPETE